MPIWEETQSWRCVVQRGTLPRSYPVLPQLKQFCHIVLVTSLSTYNIEIPENLRMAPSKPSELRVCDQPTVKTIHRLSILPRKLPVLPRHSNPLQRESGVLYSESARMLFPERYVLFYDTNDEGLTEGVKTSIRIESIGAIVSGEGNQNGREAPTAGHIKFLPDSHRPLVISSGSVRTEGLPVLSPGVRSLDVYLFILSEAL